MVQQRRAAARTPPGLVAARNSCSKIDDRARLFGTTSLRLRRRAAYEAGVWRRAVVVRGGGREQHIAPLMMIL